MNGFEFSSLNSFFELMAALNLAPAVFNPLMESYIRIFSSSLNKRKDELDEILKQRALDIEARLFAAAKSAVQNIPAPNDVKVQMNSALSHEERTARAKTNVLIESVTERFTEYTKNLVPDFRNRILSNNSRVRTSFLAAGLYCIFILLMVPLGDMLLGKQSLAQFHYHLFIISLTFSTFQILYLAKSYVDLDDKNVIWIAGFSLLTIILICVFDNKIIPFIPHNYRAFKFVVIFSIITTLLSYVLYAIKFRILVLCKLRIVEREHYKELCEIVVSHLKTDSPEESRTIIMRILDWIINRFNLATYTMSDISTIDSSLKNDSPVTSG